MKGNKPHEQGEAMLNVLHAGGSTREQVAHRFLTDSAQKVVDEFSTAEQRFFAELDRLRESDPDEFEALSPATKASYGTWRYERDHGGKRE